MAHYVPSDGLGHFIGALSKKKENERLTTTRRKRVKDPITGEQVGWGPKEIYIQERRDFQEHPLTANEKRARGNWSKACREALTIIRDKNNPRYREFYHRWREHLQSTDQPMQFPNFVRHILSHDT